MRTRVDFSSRVATRVVGSALACLLIIAGVHSTVARAAQGSAAPLPDRDTFLRNVRETLRRDGTFPSQYMFVEREEQVDYDAQGRPTRRTQNVYEVYPSVDGSPAYRRHISSNGVALPLKTIKQADEEHRKELLDWMRGRQRETAAERTRRQHAEELDRQDAQRTIDEVFRLFDIRLVGRTTIRGRPAIETSLSPRPGVKTNVKGLSFLPKVKARAWVDQQDYQVVRVEAETFDTIRIGLGLLARVDKGTTASFERQRMDDGRWLPVRSTVHPIGRIALVKRLDRKIVTDFRDYRPFSPDASASFALPKDAK